MKRTPEQAANVAAWLNMLDHCEAQLQSLGALKNPVQGRGPCVWDRLRFLKSELSEANARARVLESEVKQARERNETLAYNLKTLAVPDAAARDRRILRARKSRETIEGLQREVSRLSSEVHRRQDVSKHNEERRLELVVLAQELGCDCVPHKMPEAVKALKAPIRQRASRGGGVDEHGNRFEFDADESGACTAFAFNGVKYANEVNHKVYATLSDGTRVCRVIRTGDSWTAIHKALTTPEDGDNKSEKLPTKKPRQAISVTEEWTPAFRKLADAARDSGRKVKR